MEGSGEGEVGVGLGEGVVPGLDGEGFGVGV